MKTYNLLFFNTLHYVFYEELPMGESKWLTGELEKISCYGIISIQDPKQNLH